MFDLRDIDFFFGLCCFCFFSNHVACWGLTLLVIMDFSYLFYLFNKVSFSSSLSDWDIKTIILVFLVYGSFSFLGEICVRFKGFFFNEPLFTTTIGGYFVIHISSQTTKKKVSENPHLRTITPRKLLSLCDTITFALVQSQVFHNSRTWYNRKTFTIITASIYRLRLTLHQKLFVANPSS
jgi:hypothetical protein